MKKFILFVPILVLLILGGCSQKVKQEEVLAKFDKQVVLASELEKEISELPEWKQDKYKDQAGREEYLTLMAESRMLLQVAKERNIGKNPEIIKQVNEYQDELIREKITTMEVDEKVKILDEDLEKYYADHKDEFIEPDKVVVTEITLKDENKAKEVLEKIKNGTDFTELAKEMDSKGESFGPGAGNGGKTRPFSRDSYSSAREFVETDFKLKPGEMSDIIVQPLGQDTYYMIIRVDENIPSRLKEFSEVKDQINRTLEREKKDERKKQWIDSLKKEYKFEIFTDRIPKTPEEEGSQTQQENKEEATGEAESETK